MDIELTSDNLMDYLGDDQELDQPLPGEALLMEQMEKSKKDKDEMSKERSRFKAINEFKVKVLDFLSIYIKEVKHGMDRDKKLLIIKGLLEAMATAHRDRSDVLFDKIKAVILALAKESKDVSGKNKEDTQTITILFTEIIQKILNPKIEPKVSAVYRTAFFYLSKMLKDDKKLIKSTYKELLKCYLQKRASNTLKLEFFMTAFNEDLTFAYSFFKFLVKSSLPSSDPSSKTRTPFQRYLAVELLHFLIKRTGKLREPALYLLLNKKFTLLQQC